MNETVGRVVVGQAVAEQSTGAKELSHHAVRILGTNVRRKFVQHANGASLFPQHRSRYHVEGDIEGLALLCPHQVGEFIEHGH